MHVPSYGGIIWLKHQEMETNFKLGIKGLRLYIVFADLVTCTHFQPVAFLKLTGLF